MDLSCYYQIFIKLFSKSASPITSLQKKGVNFEWNSNCEEIFEQLKEIFKIENPDEYLVVFIDACKEGIGGVLSQKDNVECYESRKLKEHERNYATHDLELTTIVHALNVETLPCG
jgi:hypothetical protein